MSKNTMTDLKRFDGKGPSEVIRTLQDEGFKVIGGDADRAVLSSPDDDYVVRVTGISGPAEALAAMCRAYPDNPHLPKIFDTYRSEGNPPLHITVMEKLLTLDDIPQSTITVVGGGARAIATMIDGHESHDAVHEMMLKDPAAGEAARAIVEALENYLGAGNQDALRRDFPHSDFIYYASGFPEESGMSINDWYPDSILFRKRPDGSHDYVFADPFREGSFSTPQQLTQFRKELTALRQRIETLSGQPAPTKNGLPHGPSPNI